MIKEFGEGHPGGSLSIVEILISLYDNILQDDDIFILSKGHACASWFVVLREKGYNPKISGHPDRDIDNGIYTTSGSLGHGLPLGIGVALARKIQNKKGRVFVLMSDGELEEGTTWESLLIANHYKLNNLIIIIDYNKLQALDFIRNVIDLGSLQDKISSFIEDVYLVDGHNISILNTTLSIESDGPKVIIASTIKGKGVSFMENQPHWHARDLTEEDLELARRELE